MVFQKHLEIQQLEETVAPFRLLSDIHVPAGGWAKVIRRALGMTNAQLARRMRRRSAQTVLDLQAREAAGTIQLDSLRELAEAMGCRLVYALLPAKPLETLRRDRAEAIARDTIKRTQHSMALEDQGLGVREAERAYENEVETLLSGSPKRLWD